MDQTRFNAVTRTVTRLPSRRDTLRGLAAAGLGFGSLRLPETEAAKGNNKKGKKVTLCHNGQTITVSKSAVKSHKKHGDTVGPCPSAPPPPEPVLTYQCSAPGRPIDGPDSTRIAQTFTAERSGSLRQIQFSVRKDAGTTGDYVVQLLRVIGGKPSHSALDVLTTVTVPNAEVATRSDATVTATFTGPALVAGVEYAAAFSRPGSGPSGTTFYFVLGGSVCSGKLFVADGAGPFNEAFNQDMLVSVLVG